MSIYGELASGRDSALAVIDSAVLRKKPRPQCRQIPQNDGRINSTSCCLCHKYVRKDVRKVGIANAKLGQGLLGVVSTLLPFCGILTIRETRRV